MSKQFPVKVVFWQINPTPHQAAFVRALNTTDAVEVALVFQEGLSERRRKMGWNDPDYGAARKVVSPNPQEIEEFLGWGGVHIFSGAGYNQAMGEIQNRAFQLKQEKKFKLGVLSEAKNTQGLKGKARILDSFRKERSWKVHLDFVLGFGSTGTDWYKLCGYNDSTLYQFPYTVETGIASEEKVTKSPYFRVVYVGQLIKRKNLTCLIKALQKISSSKWELDIVGDGVEKERLKRLVEKLSLQDKIRFVGVLNNNEVRKKYANSDCLVLCSKFDGWGAVVNEALSEGLPVVVSDKCGSADLVIQGQNGYVFKSNSPKSLSESLEKLMKLDVDLDKRLEIRQMASSFSAPLVARYFVEILNDVKGLCSEKPSPPWKSKQINGL